MRKYSLKFKGRAKLSRKAIMYSQLRDTTLERSGGRQFSPITCQSLLGIVLGALLGSCIGYSLGIRHPSSKAGCPRHPAFSIPATHFAFAWRFSRRSYLPISANSPNYPINSSIPIRLPLFPQHAPQSPPLVRIVSHVDEFIPELNAIGNREGWLKFETDEPVRLFFQTLIMNRSGKHYMSGRRPPFNLTQTAISTARSATNLVTDSSKPCLP